MAVLCSASKTHAVSLTMALEGFPVPINQDDPLTVLTKTVLLLLVSNLFMLTAWYVHLRQWSDRPWYFAAFLSWCIAAFEYSVHIPANRIGATELSLGQLHILQVGISLLLFIPFAILVMKSPPKMDYVWATVCLMAAAYFIFRGAHEVSTI